MFFNSHYPYYLTIGLQAICVIHCLRKGNPGKWIWIIVLLPFIGSLAYLYTEVFSRQDVSKVQTGVGALFNPGGNLKKLEQNLKFSDTFKNRVMLADAYLQAGQTERAIELYLSGLTGTFEENEYVLIQLMTAYFGKERYEDVLPIAKKIQHLPQFARSKAHLLYARALQYTGNTAQAEQQYKMMAARFANYEARYYYSLLLQQMGKTEEAHALLTAMADEQPHLSSAERRDNRKWLSLAKEKL